MADWDDEDFEPPTIVKAVPLNDQWEGEDEDDDAGIKDNWDDEDEEKKPTAPPTEGEKTEKVGKKKALAKRLKEKEEAAAKIAEARRQAAEALKTPEEKMADKLLGQKLSEESDLEVAKDLFGVHTLDPGQITIDKFEPKSSEDFINFEKMLSEKISKYESSAHYETLLDTLFRSTCLGLDAETLKRIISSLNVLQNEKAKQERQKKGGKKTKAKLIGSTKGGGNDQIIDYSTYDDMDDFM